MATEVYIRGPEFKAGDGAVLLTLDASLSQMHEMSATATEHPVEEGADITDHVQPQLPRLTIQGVIAAQSLADTGEEQGREIDGWAALGRLIDEAVPVTVITTLQTYTSMVLLGVSTVRDGRRGVYPSIEMRQIRTVEQQTVTLPPERIPKKTQRASAPADQDTGRQPTDAPTAEEAAAANRSIAALISDTLGGLF